MVREPLLDERIKCGKRHKRIYYQDDAIDSETRGRQRGGVLSTRLHIQRNRQ